MNNEVVVESCVVLELRNCTKTLYKCGGDRSDFKIAWIEKITAKKGRRRIHGPGCFYIFTRNSTGEDWSQAGKVVPSGLSRMHLVESVPWMVTPC